MMKASGFEPASVVVTKSQNHCNCNLTSNEGVGTSAKVTPVLIPDSTSRWHPQVVWVSISCKTVTIVSWRSI